MNFVVMFCLLDQICLRPHILRASDWRVTGLIGMATTRLDLRGLNCPEPVLRASRAIHQIEIGDALVLECTDPLTAIDIPLFVSRSGQVLYSQERRGELLVFTIIRTK